MVSAWLLCNNGRQCTKNDDDDGKWPVDGGVMYTFLFPTDSTVLCCFRIQKRVGGEDPHGQGPLNHLKADRVKGDG